IGRSRHIVTLEPLRAVDVLQVAITLIQPLMQFAAVRQWITTVKIGPQPQAERQVTQLSTLTLSTGFEDFMERFTIGSSQLFQFPGGRIQFILFGNFSIRQSSLQLLESLAELSR